MGVIVDELRRLLERQLEEHGIVLWFDPERDYEPALPELGLSACTLLRFEGSYYQLRHEAEPLLRDAEPPRLLVYLPVEHEAARMPLAELIAFGVTLRPGEKGLANSRVGVIARRALKGLIPDSRLEKLDREIEENKLTLAELENLALGGGATHVPTVLGVIYDAPHVEDAALAFLSQAERDAELTDKNAVAELTDMLQRNYEAPLTHEMPLGEMRSTLARHVLSAEFLTGLGDETPEALQAVATPKEPLVAQRCTDLARSWRNRLDLGSSYTAAAREVERSLHLGAIGLPFAALTKIETFPATEHQLLREAAKRIGGGMDAEAEAVARKRRDAFWASREPQFQPRWDLLLQAADLRQLCDEINAALKGSLSVEEIAENYTRDERPWCRLDTLHRHFEKKAGSLDFLLTEQPEEIESLIVATRRRYAATAGQLAEAFVRGLRQTEFELAGWYRQTQVFERFVAPKLARGRVAYVMVDALRYELAVELAELLKGDFDSEIENVAGTMPGVTPVGMAALLPHASHSLSLREGKKGDIEVACGETVLRNRDNRMAYIEKHAGTPVVALKLEDPRQFKRKLNKLGDGPGLVVVTSREIDRAGEEDLTDARWLMEDVLNHLRLALRRLAEAGIEHFIVTTDHGYLFGEELVESEKIDPPGGKTLLLHRRVWVGKGGATSESYLRTTVEKLGVKGDLEIAVPWNLVGFRSSGSEAYFHGGLSPQEFLLPVVKLRPKQGVGTGQKIAWDLKLGSAKVTSVHLTVTIAGQVGLFAAEWPAVRVEVRTTGEACSIPVSATYGFSDTTGEVALRSSSDDPGRIDPNSVTLMLTAKAPTSGSVSIHLLDAVSGDELNKIDSVEVSRVF